MRSDFHFASNSFIGANRRIPIIGIRVPPEKVLKNNTVN